MYRFISSVICLFIFNLVFSQPPSDIAFAKWLYNNGKYDIAIKYLTADSLNKDCRKSFILDRCYYKKGQYNLVQPASLRLDSSKTLPSHRLLTIGVDVFYRNHLSDQFEIDEKDSIQSEIVCLYKQIAFLKNNDPASYKSECIKSSFTSLPLRNISTQIHDLQYDYERYSNKKPIVGALLSSVIPGLGKVYAHRPSEMLVPLLKCIVLGAIAYDGYERKQFKSVEFYAFGSMLLYNYSANVYGSYIAVKNSKLDNKVYYNEKLSDYFKDISDCFIDK